MMSGRPCGTRAKGHMTRKELIGFMRRLKLKQSLVNRSRTVVNKKTGKSVHPRRTKRLAEMCANIETRLSVATANIPKTVTKAAARRRRAASPAEGYKPLYQMFRKVPKARPAPKREERERKRMAKLAAKLAERARRNRMAIKNNIEGYKPLYTLFPQKKTTKKRTKKRTTKKMSPLLAALTAARAINYRANPRRSTRTTKNPYRR